IALRWSLQRGYLPLPKSVTPERIRANGDVFDFELNDADMDLITNLKGCCGEAADPDKVPF
ncbi:MAG: aldo/keto reductase, partial [Eubacteriales bacterium]|nr:aldo/keto reductase [Eubacteriales bacterium]